MRTDNSTRRQGVYWIGTISKDQNWIPTLPPNVLFLKGQLEEGEGGFQHYQIFFIAKGKKSINQINAIFEPTIGHWELTRSSAAEEYVWKEESRIGEQFEFGKKPFKRNNATDWAAALKKAKEGKIDEIEPDIQIRYHFALRSILQENIKPVAMVRECIVFWGKTGTGKSRLAWEEAGNEAYSKNPRTKWWDGYNQEEHVIIDEFRGSFDISYFLTWTDRYPVRVEKKGTSTALMAKKIWITSNIHPLDWYPDLDMETKAALMRRLTRIVEF